MENRPKSTQKITQLQKSKQKFKNLNIEYNQLQSKYDIYKNGTPNNYKQEIQSLKAYNVKNNIRTLELPSIDYLLQEIKNIPQNSGTNMRNYKIHPSMLQKYGNKFKNMISDQQELKDFMEWFNTKQKQIFDRKDEANSKFHLYQNLIASGFNEIITQLSSISRSRSQILKTLWNKQNEQFEKIINLFHKQTSELQKNNLQTIRSLHIGYQEQIIEIKNQNYNIQKKNEQANILNESCINTLRTMRKQIKKYEKIIKQLNESNYYLKQQSLKLLQENINLHMKEKNISFQQARVLSYQKLYLSTMKKQLKKNQNTKNIFKDIKNKAEYLVDNSQFHDVEQKKQKLLKFIKNRLKGNPSQKIYILKGQFSEEQDQQIKLQHNIQQMLRSKEYRQEIQSKVSKNKAVFFKQVATNTQDDQKHTSHFGCHDMGIQTVDQFNNQIVNFISLNKKQEQEDKKKLRDKKVLHRHSLMMIEINKMMEFKKIDNANKIRRLSKFSNIEHSRSNSIQNNTNEQKIRNSLNDSNKNIQCSGLQIQQLSVNGPKQTHIQKLEQIWEVKNNREENIKRRHHQSLLAPKSTQFQSMINRLSRDMSDNENQSSKKSSCFKQDKDLQQKQSQQLNQINHSRFASTFSYSQKQKKNIFKQSKFKQIYKNESEGQKIQQFKDLVRKFIQKKGQHRELINNPQKHLKKILTDTFKNLYISKKTNFIKQIIKTAKNCYGKIVYENKLIHLISMIIQNKQKSLLSALTLLLNICGFQQNFAQVNNQDINQLYFKIYFTLSLKNPTQNQFNIWNSYTNIQKLSYKTFMDILKTYFHDNKCVYLQLKIRQFIGFSSKDQVDSNYYVQLNPLMMYIIEVYLSEKKNYYDSYHQIIDFLSEGDHLELQTFIFMLDLICLKEQEQRQLIYQYFDNKTQKEDLKCAYCHKDVFYRICVKYEVPLFQFIKILKLQQFKKLHDYIQNDYIDINDSVKWLRIKESLQKRIKSKNKLGISLRKVIQKLDNYIKGSYKVQNQPFLFFYRIIVFIAFGEI